jgi:hypothetical protein
MLIFSFTKQELEERVARKDFFGEESYDRDNANAVEKAENWLQKNMAVQDKVVISFLLDLKKLKKLLAGRKIEALRSSEKDFAKYRRDF